MGATLRTSPPGCGRGDSTAGASLSQLRAQGYSGSLQAVAWPVVERDSPSGDPGGQAIVENLWTAPVLGRRQLMPRADLCRRGASIT